MVIAILPLIAYCCLVNAENGVTRTTLIRRFTFENSGPMELECGKDRDFNSVEAYSVCRSDIYSKTSEKSWPSHRFLKRAHDNYCQESFNAGNKCIIDINNPEAVASRFNAKDGLTCEDSVYVGVYWCTEKNSKPVEDGEEVTLFNEVDQRLELKCPAGRKIVVKNAQRFGNIQCDHGFRENILQSVRYSCDGKQSCLYLKDNTPIENCEGLKNYHVVTYTCVCTSDDKCGIKGV